MSSPPAPESRTSAGDRECTLPGSPRRATGWNCSIRRRATWRPRGLGTFGTGDDNLFEAALAIARHLGELPEVRDLSNGMLALGTVPGDQG